MILEIKSSDAWRRDGNKNTLQTKTHSEQEAWQLSLLRKHVSKFRQENTTVIIGRPAGRQTDTLEEKKTQLASNGP